MTLLRGFLLCGLHACVSTAVHRADDRADAANRADAQVDAPLATPDGDEPQVDVAVPQDMTPVSACAAATELVPGVDRSFTVELPPGGATYFVTTVAVGQRLVVRAAGSTDSFVRLFDDCDASTELAEGTGGVGYPNDALLLWTNTGTEPRRVVLAVGRFGDRSTPARRVTVAFTEPAPNARCASATLLAPGVTLFAQHPARGEEPAHGLSCTLGSQLSGRALWYRVHVPGDRMLTVRARATGRPQGELQIEMYASCTGGILFCGGVRDVSDVTARWSDTFGDFGSAGVDVLVSVGTDLQYYPTTFDIVAELSPKPPNTTCEAATVLRDRESARAQYSVEASAPTPVCTGASVTSPLYYALDVPPGQRATAAVKGERTLSLQMISGCAEPRCLGFARPIDAVPPWTNTSPSTQRVYFIVSEWASRGSTFDVVARLHGAVSCEGAVRVATGVLPDERLSLAGAPGPTCVPSDTMPRPTLYYVARVGAGEQLVAQVRPRSFGSWSPVLRLVDGCTTSRCLASSDSGTPGADTTRLTWTNTGAARDVLILVSANGDGESFDLATSVGAPPPRGEAVPGACDVLTTPTVVPRAAGDDVGAPSIALPFGMRYFGVTVGAWSASSNGYLQLWPANGVSAGVRGGWELPSSRAPWGVVAPFWGDLDVGADDASVRWQFFPTPAHLTVEWNNVRPCCDESPDRLTFQAKLFESGAVEFHYCAAADSPRARGAGASIGMQDTMGLVGTTWAVDREGAATPGTGVRFSPAM